MEILNSKLLTFDDVLLVPQYSEMESRALVDVSTNLNRLRLDTPLVSAPMDTITNGEMAVAMARFGGLGIIHRYQTLKEQLTQAETALSYGEDLSGPVGVAVGVKKDYIERAKAAQSAGCNVICVDVAHGHHFLVERALKSLRDSGIYVHLMAGNIGTFQSYIDLADWGADSVRVGLSYGSVCMTKNVTGFGMPTLQAIIDCSLARTLLGRGPAIIADGGIRSSGDIVKALACGADAVMLGFLLAGTKECPQIKQVKDGWAQPIIRGMASKSAQQQYKGSFSNVEGTIKYVEPKGSVSLVITQICDGIRSGVSYSGGRNLKDLRAKARLARI